MRGKINCRVYLNEEGRATLTAYITHETVPDALYERLLVGDTILEQQILLAASEEAAKRGIEVLGWEWTHRSSITNGIADFYEGAVSEDSEPKTDIFHFEAEVVEE